MADSLTSLHEHFGFADFREGQREVVTAILEGNDAVVVMPTGSGKSLCYQLPAMMLDGATVVVSPLIALMKDQVDALRARGLPATFINSSIDSGEQNARINGLRRGDFKLVYVAPERFRSQRFLEALRSLRISLFAVDEAHCISTWGHDFRPDYLKLKGVLQLLNSEGSRTQTLALTATATPYVRSDIVEQLGLLKPRTFVSGFDRPNLTIDVVHTEKEREKVARIKRLARMGGDIEGSGIIYASTRKAVEQVALALQSEGLRVTAYHAGLGDAARVKAQDDFMSGRAQMIVATNAFGMGIDKPDIRFVAHYQMPGSIEAYYQEIGRAGRDGLPSSCVLFFNYADKNTHDFFIEGSYPSPELIRDVYGALVSTGLQRVELSTSEIARRAGVRNEMAVQSSLYVLERAGHIARTSAADKRGSVNEAAPWDKTFHGGAASLGAASVLPASDPQKSATRSSRHQHRSIIMLDTAPVTVLRVDSSDVARRAALERRKLREMIEFCYTEYCYRAHILNYFGDARHARKCGTCGNCNPNSPARIPLTREEMPAEAVRSRSKSGKSRSSSSIEAPAEFRLRSLTLEESVCIRKVLACAARMRGRFGKTILAGTLRGSAAKNVIEAKLNELSTYGLLRDLRQEVVLILIDALVVAGCLRMSPGAYPTVSITELGERVMREQETIELELPDL